MTIKKIELSEVNLRKIFNEVLKERASDFTDTNNRIKNIDKFVQDRIKNDFFEESVLERSIYLSNFRRSILEEGLNTNVVKKSNGVRL